METRMRDILSMQNNIGKECEKTVQYINNIKEKSQNIINHLEKLNTPTFLRQFVAMNKYLYELNERLIDHNCKFELFFLEVLDPLLLLNSSLQENISKNISSEVHDITNTVSSNEIEICKNSVSLKRKTSDGEHKDSFENKKLSTLTTEPTDLQKTEKLPSLNKIEALNLVVSKQIKDSQNMAIEQVQELRNTVTYKSQQDAKNDHNNVNIPTDIAKTLTQKLVIKPGPIPKEGDLCFISYIESPSSFYIQSITDDTAIIDYLSDEIAEVVPNLPTFTKKADAFRVIKQYCVCFIEKYGTWFRAEILNWVLEFKDNVQVRLLDYGDVFLVPLKYIKEALSTLFLLPIMATKCEMAWIKPLKENEDWSSDSINSFEKILWSKTACLFVISHLEQDGDRVIVDLQNKDITSVAGEMIAQSQAVDGYYESSETSESSSMWCNDFMQDQIIKSQGFNKDELISGNVDIEDDDDDDFEEHTDATMAVAHYKPRDETQICKFFLVGRHCYKGTDCKFSHVPLNPAGWTTDREPVYFQCFNKLMLPPVGEKTVVRIMSVVNLTTFYVHLKHLQPERTTTHFITDMKHLVNVLHDPIETKQYKNLKVKPACGELILILHDKKWYRGRTLECYEFGNRVELDVFLVDFGIILENVNMKNARSIEEKHLHVPFQAIFCKLANTLMKENISEETTKNGFNYLQQNVLNKKLNGTILWTDNVLTMDICDENGNNIVEPLIKSEILEYTPDLCMAVLVD